MKPFKDYDKVDPYANKEKLVPGGYVLRIEGVKYETKPGVSDQIILSFDIYEGEFKDFFMKNWIDQTQEDKKWKGTYRIWIPTDDGSETDGWSKRRFKTIMNAFEDSNPGYAWDWNEQGLKGKLIGGIFNRKEYDFNGRTGFFTQCYMLTDVDSIRDGNFKIPEDTLLKKTNIAYDSAPMPPDDGFMKVPETDMDELPF